MNRSRQTLEGGLCAHTTGATFDRWNQELKSIQELDEDLRGDGRVASATGKGTKNRRVKYQEGASTMKCY